MFKRILVPLDGSKLAECAIPYAEELARGWNAEEIILVSVTERVGGRTRAPEAEELYRSSDFAWLEGAGSEIAVTFGKKERQAQAYLEKIAGMMEAKGIKVRIDVLVWKPAEAIVSYAEQTKCDLIVMASHGRSGPSRWTHGSVAEKVFRGSNIPILMIKAPANMPGI